jgi:hypothetical protein
MKTESFPISSHMTHQAYPLSVKRNDFRKKKATSACGNIEKAIDQHDIFVINSLLFMN